MLPLLAIIPAALGCFIITEIIRFAMLHWREIVNWFQNWINGHQSVDKDAVGFTLREIYEKGEYKVVQGVFNKSSGKVEDARRIEADDLDSETRKQCFEEKLTIFN